VSRGSRCSDGCSQRAWLLKNSLAQDSQKQTSRWERPTNCAPNFLGILYPSNFRAWEETGLFQQPELISSTSLGASPQYRIFLPQFLHLLPV